VVPSGVLGVDVGVAQDADVEKLHDSLMLGLGGGWGAGVEDAGGAGKGGARGTP
jgi:hypothetical protein